MSIQLILVITALLLQTGSASQKTGGIDGGHVTEGPEAMQTLHDTEVTNNKDVHEATTQGLMQTTDGTEVIFIECSTGEFVMEKDHCDVTLNAVFSNILVLIEFGLYHTRGDGYHAVCRAFTNYFQCMYDAASLYCEQNEVNIYIKQFQMTYFDTLHLFECITNDSSIQVYDDNSSTHQDYEIMNMTTAPMDDTHPPRCSQIHVGYGLSKCQEDYLDDVANVEIKISGQLYLTQQEALDELCGDVNKFFNCNWQVYNYYCGPSIANINHRRMVDDFQGNLDVSKCQANQPGEDDEYTGINVAPTITKNIVTVMGFQVALAITFIILF